MLTMLGLAYAFSTKRRAIRPKTVAWGLFLQLTFAFFVLRFELGRRIFEIAGFYVNRLLSFSYVGSEFVFGEIGKKISAMGFSFAFQVLPTIIFIAAFFALLYHIGVMMLIVRIAAWIMTAVMGASGAESLNVAASIFMGQTEAPLTIRPFLNKLTKSELMTVMTSGMAHVSGGIMAAYIAFGIEAKHLLTAVIMTAPGTLLMAKMLVPETEQPLTAGRVQMPEMEKEANVLGAISRAAGLAQFHDGLDPQSHRVVSRKLAANFRLAFCSRGVGDRHSLARLQNHRQSAGNTHGHQRTGGLPAIGHAEGLARSAIVYHRDVCFVRLRQL
jgi:CNT family concentrative nucleoside transporter